MLKNPQFFLVRADGRWFVLCLTCITAGDHSGRGVACHRCGMPLWRWDARTVTVKRLFRKPEVRYQCPENCLADPGEA